MNSRIVIAVLLGSLAAVQPIAAQDVEPADAPKAQDEADAHKQAEKLFEQIVEAYRAGPIRDTMTFTSITRVDDVEKKNTDEFMFLFDNAGRAFLDLNELKLYVPGDGSLYILHEGNDERYFQASYEGELTSDVFLDNIPLLPFPQIPLVLAEDALWEFFMLTPLEIVSSAPREIDGKTVRELVMDGPESHIILRVDPETKLLSRVDVTIRMPAAGSYERTIAMEMTPQRLEQVEDGAFTPDLTDRIRVDELGHLQPARRMAPQAAPDGVEQAHPQHPLVGTRLPEFQLALLKGGIVESSSLEGWAVVLDLWATWCGPCLIALPHVDQAARTASEEDLPVRFFAVNVWERGDTDARRVEQVHSYWDDKDFILPVLMDHGNALGEALNVGGIPFTVIVRPDGVIHAVHVGVEGGRFDDIAPMLLGDIKAAIEASE
ncbi:MAG: TlpA family protein disulfide reductase [Phycisphaerales bacterium]|nr:TlpA family protein disulfide reductase [Phycisphaerales bacterium]